MSQKIFKQVLIAGCLLSLFSCSFAKKTQVDILIENGQVYTGINGEAQALDIALCADIICGVYP